MKTTSLRTTISVLGFLSVAVLTVALVSLVMRQLSSFTRELAAELDRRVEHETTAIARGVQQMVAATHESLSEQLTQSLALGEYLVARAGGASFGRDQVAWSAVNQYTQQTVQVSLPRLLIGADWLGQNASFDRPTPLVDELSRLGPQVVTVFQRMNDEGDMLRTATNVPRDGQRAIGTYIPARREDGTPDPVVATVLGGETFVGRAFVVDQWYLTRYAPLRDRAGAIVGMLFVGVRQDSVSSLRKGVLETTVGKTGYAYVVGASGRDQGRYLISAGGRRDGEVIWDSAAPDGTRPIQTLVEKARAAKGAPVTVTYAWQDRPGGPMREKLAVATYFEPWDWVVAAGAYVDEFQEAQHQLAASRQRMMTAMIGGALGLMLLIMIGWWVLARRITAPLVEATRFAERTASGDLSTRVEVRTSDETGQLSRALNQMSDQLGAFLSESATTAGHVRTASGEVASASQAVADSVTQQAASLEEVTLNLSNVTQGLTASARRADEARGMAAAAREQAQQGRQVLDGLSGSIERISKAVSGSSQIIDDIDGVAFQTNLLALNASVEAARAGEAGRGFAVVAQQIRALAESSKDAARRTGALIRESVDLAQSCERQSATARLGFTEIVAATERAEQVVLQVAQATREQADRVAQVHEEARRMEQAIHANSASAEELSGAAESLAQQSEQMAQQVRRFKLAETRESATPASYDEAGAGSLEAVAG